MKVTIEDSEGFGWRTQTRVSRSGLKERQSTFNSLMNQRKLFFFLKSLSIHTEEAQKAGCAADEKLQRKDVLCDVKKNS